MRDLLPDAGDDRERRRVARHDGAADRIGSQGREEAERDLGAHAGHAGELIEQLTLVGGREPVERHGVLADHQARVDPRRPTDGREGGHHRGRDGHDVADAGDRQYHVGRRLLDDLALEEGDHRVPDRTRVGPGVRPAARMRDPIRCVSAIATASTASAWTGQFRSPWIRTSASRT